MVQLCGLSSIHLTPRPKKCDPRTCWGPGTAGAGGGCPHAGCPCPAAPRSPGTQRCRRRGRRGSGAGCLALPALLELGVQPGGCLDVPFPFLPIVCGVLPPHRACRWLAPHPIHQLMGRGNCSWDLQTRQGAACPSLAELGGARARL